MQHCFWNIRTDSDNLKLVGIVNVQEGVGDSHIPQIILRYFTHTADINTVVIEILRIIFRGV